MTNMPAAFLGHGSPMNALEHNRFTEAWAEFGRSVPRPRAILAISAHWYINATAVTSSDDPRIIHDFYGFPQELFDFRYPAPGSIELAKEVIDLVQPTWVGLDDDSWGIDHGTWSVLAHAFPEADVPVVQLSIDASKPFEYHQQLGAQLAPLADEGVLIVASGNVVHNLRGISWGAVDQGYDWAHRFDDDVRTVMVGKPSELAALRSHDDYALSVPTPDHFLPLAYVAGIADVFGSSAEVLVDGCTMGSLSMTSYVVRATTNV
jgi:4,5-DOPA dioxygenase extradiol